MQKIQRVKRSAATWRQLFSRQAASGLAVAEFCRREGINAGLFRRWRATLASSWRDKSDRVQPPSRTEAAAPFIDLGATGPGASGWQVRLELGGGMVLNLVRD